MTDYIAYGTTGNYLNPNAQIEIASNLAAGTIITDFRWHLGGQYGEEYTSGTIPFPAAPTLVFGWEIVPHGTAATPITAANIDTSTYIYSASPKFDTLTITGFALTGASLYMASIGAHHELWSPETLAAASDVYLCLSFLTQPTYGAGIESVVTTELLYHAT